jgi:hypothetical protein
MEYVGKESRMGAAPVMDRSGAQTATARRRFRLLDAMILVAATALGCGELQWLGRETGGDVSWTALCDGYWEFFRQTPGESWAGVAERTLELSLLIAWLTMPLIAMWTLALIPIRLLGPRPRTRRLARQPGMVTTCASGVAIVFTGLQVVVAAMAEGWENPMGLIGTQQMVAFVPMFFGLAVSVSWMTLLVGRRWRAEPSWVDRLGRATGVFWIVAGFAVTGMFLFACTRPVCEFRARTINPPPAVEAEREIDELPSGTVTR